MTYSVVANLVIAHSAGFGGWAHSDQCFDRQTSMIFTSKHYQMSKKTKLIFGENPLANQRLIASQKLKLCPRMEKAPRSSSRFQRSLLIVWRGQKRKKEEMRLTD